MLRFLVLAFICLFSFTAHAKDIRPSVVAVWCEAADGSTLSLGTGTVVSSWQVITAAHVVDDCEKIELQFFSGKILPAQIQWKSDRKIADLAVLTASIPDGVPHIRMAKTAPEFGESVTLVGFPRGMPWVGARGTVAGFGNGLKPNEMAVNIFGNHGSSGGAILNSRGEVVAIVSRGLEEKGLPIGILITVLTIGVRIG